MAIWPVVVELPFSGLQRRTDGQADQLLSKGTGVNSMKANPSPSPVPDQQKKNEESENKKKKEVNLVISHAPSADNSNLSADGDDSFISVEMDSAMPSPFSEVRDSTNCLDSSVFMCYFHLSFSPTVTCAAFCHLTFCFLSMASFLLSSLFLTPSLY